VRSGLRTLAFYGAVWLLGTFGCIAVNIATNGQADWYEHAAFLFISAMGFTAGCWHINKPEESLLWEEHSLRALRAFTASYTGAGILVAMASVVFFMVRAMNGASYLSVLWLLFAGVWMVVSVHLMDMWRLKTLGEVCGWDSAPKK